MITQQFQNQQVMQADWMKINENLRPCNEHVSDQMYKFNLWAEINAVDMCEKVYDPALRKGDMLKKRWGFIDWVCIGVYTATRLSIVDDGKFSLWEGNHGNYYSISLRGTTSVGDWLRSLNPTPVNIDSQGHLYPFCWTAVHEGFRNRVIHLLLEGDNGTALKCMLEKAIQGKNPLLITGHSLGGAEARLLAEMLLQGVNGFLSSFGKFPENLLKVVTFGQPRLYTAFSHTSYMEMSRYVNTNQILNKIDFVPLIPPVFSFAQGGFQLIKTEESVVIKLRGISFPDWCTLKYHSDLGEHSIHLYRKNLEEHYMTNCNITKFSS